MDTLKSEDVNSLPIDRREMLQLEEDLLDKLDNAVLGVGDGNKRLDIQRGILTNFIDNQLTSKDQYRHIFKTDNGSVYFILETGESFRIKMAGEEYDLVQPGMEKILFVDDKQHEELVEIFSDKQNQEGRTVGFKINTQDLKVGMMPVEFGIIGMPKIRFEEKPGEILILGDKMGYFASGLHFGLHISEIIK